MSRRIDRPRSVDVAALAGVSRSAVSRTFTEGASVSPATRQKVLQAAEALGYRPNALARTLITRRSGIIGLVIADMMNPFYSATLEALSHQLQRFGLSPLVFSCRDARHLDEFIPKLLSYQVDGVMIAAATLSSKMAIECARAGRPVVLVNRYVNYDEVSSVVCDNIAAGRLVADHLIECGCQSIALVSGLQNTSSARDREIGFNRALLDHGRRLSRRVVGNYNYEDAQEAARSLFSSSPCPDAVFCANDLMALAVIDTARDTFDLSVPGDLAVAGVDNIPASAWTSYRLTTIDQNIELMAETAVDLLMERLQDSSIPPVHKKISPSLQVRESTTRDKH